MSSQVGPVAGAIAQLVIAFPERAAIDLHEMIEHKLSIQARHETREIELGLLVEMMETLRRLPGREEYRDEVERRAASGDSRWPQSNQVETIFGRWDYALSAALYIAEDRDDRLVRRKDDGRIAGNRRQKYSRDECKSALIKCFRTLGDWPEQPSEYQAWQRLHRRRALLADSASDDWMPTAGVIRNKFGTWERALELAQKKHHLQS